MGIRSHTSTAGLAGGPDGQLSTRLLVQAAQDPAQHIALARRQAAESGVILGQPELQALPKASAPVRQKNAPHPAVLAALPADQPPGFEAPCSSSGAVTA